MLKENKELYEKYLKEALECAKICTLGLTKTLKEKLEKIQLVTVSDLEVLENNMDERICDSLLEDEIKAIISERNKFIHIIERMLYISIDPENCTIGPINKYYEILLAIEKFEEKYYKNTEINMLFMEENSISIDRINLILTLFEKKDIELLELRLCDKKQFNEIALQCQTSSKFCKDRVSFLIKRIYNSRKMFMPNSGKTVTVDEEFSKDVTKKDECIIYFLDLNESVYTALIRNDIYTVGELKEAIRNKKIFDIRNIGAKTYDRIIQAIGL